MLDEFAPDLVVIWGDDQYENFREDVIPPFCLLAYEEMAPKPWEYHRAANAWNEPQRQGLSITRAIRTPANTSPAR